MMRLARRPTILVAFCLLTSAATAHAECAWVVWEEHQYGPYPIPRNFGEVWPSTTWKIEAAHEMRAACQAALQRVAEATSRHFRQGGTLPASSRSRLRLV